jgi:hypothetical protein
MRKNLDRDEPDHRWTDKEILGWAVRTGVLDEAHNISDTKQELNKSSGSSKRAQ